VVRSRGRKLYQCNACRHQSSLIAGTVFQPRRSRKRTQLCSPERTQRVRAVMPGKGSRGPWNKCGGFIAAFMPRKPLDALEGAHARGSAGDGFYHPRRLPPGEGGVWGNAPGFVEGLRCEYCLVARRVQWVLDRALSDAARTLCGLGRRNA
jgi:hypothetical protein